MATLAALEELGGGEPDVILVDNGPTGAVEDLNEIRGVRVLPSPRRQGFAANVNLGLAATRSRLVLLLNDDARLDGRNLERLIAELDSSNAALCVPRVVSGDGRQIASAWRFPTSLGIAAFALGPSRWPYVQSRGVRPRWVEAASAGVLLMHRESVVAIGGFDEGYFMYGEDTDLCRRLEKIGLRRLYAPAAHAVHETQSSTTVLTAEREREQWRGRHRYWDKHCTRADATIAKGMLASVYLAAYLIVRLTRRNSDPRRYARFARYSLRAPRGHGLREVSDAWNAQHLPRYRRRLSSHSTRGME